MKQCWLGLGKNFSLTHEKQWSSIAHWNYLKDTSLFYICVQDAQSHPEVSYKNKKKREAVRFMPQETAYVHQDCTNSSSSIVPQHDALLISWAIVPPSERICIIDSWCDLRILFFLFLFCQVMGHGDKRGGASMWTKDGRAKEQKLKSIVAKYGPWCSS